MEQQQSEDEVCVPLSNLSDVLKYKDYLSRKVPYIFKRDEYVIHNANTLCHHNSQCVQIDQRIDRFTVPKTLVCHDMKGGYLEDRFVNGCNTGNGYTFYRWSNIDIFIYFSHHLVTIPPVGWIKVAHDNNVKILGTFITEWKDGEKICSDIFESERSWTEFARALVNISLNYNFDGWLLNIENEIKDTKPVIQFIAYLTKEMHRVHSESVVLWYDSIIKTGELKWQNELNELNKCYFDICDGIFVNYTWKEKNLATCVLQAEERLFDVFIGVDVFGRNFYGGGGFNTHSALQLIRKYNLSAAIFGQGWTHETIKPEDTNEFFEFYLQRDNAFWLNIYPYLYTHPVKNNFVTTFNLGADKDTYNLLNQQLVINRPAHCGKDYLINCEINHECDCIKVDINGAKWNTISYLISKPHAETEEEYGFSLLKCSIIANKNFVISCLTKSFTQNESRFYLYVLTQYTFGKYERYKLIHEKLNNENKYVRRPFSENSPHMSLIKEDINYGHISDGWETRYFYISVVRPLKILDIGIALKESSLLLGGLAVKTDLEL